MKHSHLQKSKAHEYMSNHHTLMDILPKQGTQLNNTI